MFVAIVLISILALTVVLPLAIFFGRNNIKKVRESIIKDLEQVFQFKDQDTDKLIPSFEFAAYKYRALPSNAQAGDLDFAEKSYALPVALFIVVSFCGFASATGLFIGVDEAPANNFFLNGLKTFSEKAA